MLGELKQNLVHTRIQEPHKRLSQICLCVFECLLWSHRSAVTCCRDRDSGCSRPGSPRVWHKPSWRRSSLTHHRAARTYTGLGNILLEGTNKTLCAPGTPQRLSQTCLCMFECLLWRYGSAVACCRGRGSGCQTWVWNKPSWKSSPLSPP